MVRKDELVTSETPKSNYRDAVSILLHRNSFRSIRQKLPVLRSSARISFETLACTILKVFLTDSATEETLKQPLQISQQPPVRTEIFGKGRAGAMLSTAPQCHPFRTRDQEVLPWLAFALRQPALKIG